MSFGGVVLSHEIVTHGSANSTFRFFIALFSVFFRFVVLFCHKPVTWCYGKNHPPKKLSVNARLSKWIWDLSGGKVKHPNMGVLCCQRLVCRWCNGRCSYLWVSFLHLLFCVSCRSKWYSKKLLHILEVVGVRLIIHIKHNIGLSSHGYGKKSFMWEFVFMVAVLARNNLIFVPFYPNILENVCLIGWWYKWIWEFGGIPLKYTYMGGCSASGRRGGWSISAYQVKQAAKPQH